MAEYVTLTCPSCGSKLNITENIDRFACSHCGNEHIVNRGDGIVTISPIVEGLEKVQRGTDKTASELAINRLNKEIAELEHKKEMERAAAYGGTIGWLIFFECLILLPALFCTFGTGVLIIYRFIGGGLIILSIVVGINYFNQFKKSEDKKKLERMKLIKRKNKELRKHLDEVSD